MSLADITLRLQGSLSQYGTGRVEVFFNGQWGTICDDGWDFKDARVVCRQLGYQFAVRALYGGQVPHGSGRIWLNEVECKGMEQNLLSCSHSGWEQNYCSHDQDAGVECVSTADILLRLQGSLIKNGTGRVEVFFNGQWGTICDYGWDFKDAEVVCRQLGYLDAVRALHGGEVPHGSGRIWLDEVECKGMEQNLMSCSHRGWGENYCSHDQDAGVECVSTAYKTLRLQGSLSKNGTGRVEVFFYGQWGTICDDGWDFKDARVVCRQLGYQDAVRALRGGQVPDGSGRIWLDEVGCKGMEQNLLRCSHSGWGKHACSHDEDAGVECFSTANVTLRLQGSLSENGRGRVEVFFNGRWGTICDDGWDFKDAEVVCRQLGYQGAVRALRGSEVPNGSARVWLDEVECKGMEQNLISCSHAGWGEHDCSHDENAGVECVSTGKDTRNERVKLALCPN
ncbi:deleted in malignant brain tumors 1 protein-like [Dendronephthya gigantea]|uniref:deleted in malignant brain tumors 1 protein-like n=1 Tax=Dendronephthya gigantea TaxID=151771 RepID=UPI00106BE18C|nr:deleted in malignant brain tumors 1 protein-like [Dendronephthya gigantea]